MLEISISTVVFKVYPRVYIYILKKGCPIMSNISCGTFSGILSVLLKGWCPRVGGIPIFSYDMGFL